ncbi:hypothetical protein LEMLEM_LOCUS9272, partial [Lemmus lemmus]
YRQNSTRTCVACQGWFRRLEERRLSAFTSPAPRPPAGIRWREASGLHRDCPATAGTLGSCWGCWV